MPWTCMFLEVLDLTSESLISAALTPHAKDEEKGSPLDDFLVAGLFEVRVVPAPSVIVAIGSLVGSVKSRGWRSLPSLDSDSQFRSNQ